MDHPPPGIRGRLHAKDSDYIHDYVKPFLSCEEEQRIRTGLI